MSSDPRRPERLAVGAGSRLAAAAAALMLTIVACTQARLEVREPFIASLFEGPLEGTALAGDQSSSEGFEGAMASFRRGDLERALARLDWVERNAVVAAIELYPVDAARGAVYLAAGDSARARVTLERALSSRPSYAAALIVMAALLHLEGDDEGALIRLDRARATVPGHGGAARLRARVVARAVADTLERARQAELRSDPKQALVEVRRAAELAPHDAKIRAREGSLALVAGDIAGAVSAYRAAVSSRPNDADSWLGLGEAYMQRGDHEPAREAFERASGLPGGIERAKRMVAILRDRERRAARSPELERTISAPSVDRAGLAALMMARLPSLRRISRSSRPVIITDVAGSASRRQIQELVGLGILEVYDNHTFRPQAPVTRVMMARAAAAVLRAYRQAGWLSERPAPALTARDLPPEHVEYANVMQMLRFGVMSVSDQGEFRPFDLVSGRVAAEVVERLARLVQ